MSRVMCLGLVALERTECVQLPVLARTYILNSTFSNTTTLGSAIRQCAAQASTLIILKDSTVKNKKFGNERKTTIVLIHLFYFGLLNDNGRYDRWACIRYRSTQKS